MWCQYYPDFIRGAFTLISAAVGVVIGALLGMHAYFRQKEYELVKGRYLEGGLDVVASEVEQHLGIAKHNWARCLNILKAFRGEGMAFNKEELTKGFLDLEMSRLNRIAHHRIEGLVGLEGAQVVWSVYQLALADAANNNFVYTKEVPEVVHKKLTTDLIKDDPQAIVERLFPDLFERDERSHRFAHLVRCLYHLGAMLEKERMTFKQIAGFKDRERVKALIAELARDFQKEIADVQDEPSASDPAR